MERDHNHISEDNKGETILTVLGGFSGGVTLVTIAVAIAKYYEPGVQDVIDIPQANLLLKSAGGVTGILAALNCKTNSTI